MGQTKTGEEPAHLKFCRLVEVLFHDTRQGFLNAEPQSRTPNAEYSI